MNETQLKGLLDLVVKTVNDLSKHHAGETLELVSSEVASEITKVHGELSEVLNNFERLDTDQTQSYQELTDVIKKLDHIDSSLSEKLETTVETIRGEVDEKADALSDQATSVKKDVVNLIEQQSDKNQEFAESITELSSIDESIAEKLAVLTGSTTLRLDVLHNQCLSLNKEINTLVKANESQIPKHVIDELQESVELLTELTDKDTANHRQKLFGLAETVIKITDELGKINDNVDMLRDVPGHVSDIDKALYEVVETTESLGSIQRDHEEAIEKIVTDIVKANDHIGRLKASLVGCGDDLRVLSNDMHTRMDECEEQDATAIEAADSIRADIVKLGQENDSLIKSLTDQYDRLVGQFNELKNESFLSSDKIDMKFAEMKLNLVEMDVERENRVKAAIGEQGDEIVDSLNKKFETYTSDVGRKLDNLFQETVNDVNGLLDTKAQNIRNSKQWVPGDWLDGAVCRNRAGLWQAIRDTDAEPTVESADWICGASGFHSAQVIATHATGLNVTVGVEDTLGNVHEIKIPLPKINYIKGTHDPEKDDYLYNDSIMKDGCRWVATKDHPEHDPGDEGEDWAVLTMRGPKGHAGKTGDTGKQGLTGDKGNKGDKGAKGAKGNPGVTPEMDDIVKALIDFESAGDGQAIRRARGHWKLGGGGVPYKAGDVVTVGTGLFVGLNDNDGTQTPVSSTEDWLMLVQGSVGAGAPGADGADGADGVDADAIQTYDLESLSGEVVDVPDNYPANVDTVAGNEIQVRLEVADRAAGNYVVNFYSRHNIDAIDNSVLTRHSVDGGASWHENSRESKDATDEIEKYTAFPIVHAGGKMDIVMQMKKENVGTPADTLIVRKIDVWADAKFGVAA